MTALSRAQAGAAAERVGPSDQIAEAQDARASVAGVAHPVPISLLAVGLGAAAFASYRPGPGAAMAAVLVAVLAVLSAIDIQQRRIPNAIVLPAAVAMIIARFAFFGDQGWKFALIALGAGVAFLIPNLINRAWIGMGDVKLAVLLGAGMGWGVIGATMLAFLLSFPVAVGMLVRHGGAARHASLPFGPFLALGAFVVIVVAGLFGTGGS